MEPDDTTAAPTVAPETPPADADGHPSAGGPSPPVEPPDDGQRQTFDRAYVEKLRKSEAGYRLRAKHADALGARLVTAYAAQTGLLADATDLAYDDALCGDDGVPDPVKVAAAVDALLDVKPHFATRRPAGDVGQGPRSDDFRGVSLAGLLRAGAS